MKFGDDPLQKLSNNYDGTFFKHSKRLQAVNHFRKTFIFAKIFTRIQNTSLLCIRQIHAQSQQIQGPSTTFIQNLYICTCSKVFYRTSCSDLTLRKTFVMESSFILNCISRTPTQKRNLKVSFSIYLVDADTIWEKN